MKKTLIFLIFTMVLSVILSCYSLGADSPSPTSNKGAVCSQVCHFGDVYISVDGRDQVEGIQGMAIAGSRLFTAVTRKGHRLSDGSRPSLYTTLIQTDLKTMEQKTIVTDYYDDPQRIGIGHANDMTAVTDTVNGTTYTYVLVTRYLRSATLLRISSDGLIDKTAVIVWKGATAALQEEIASNRMNTTGLAFTSAKDGSAQLLIANKNKFYTAEIDLRNMTLSGKLQEAFTLSEEAISEEIHRHFGAYGQKYDEGTGSGWGYQGISYDKNTNKIYLPLPVVKDVSEGHEYRAAVLVYDKKGNLLPAEGFVFQETSMEIEAIDFYGSYLYWDAICYDPIASQGIPEGNRVFRMWTKANFTFDKSNDADAWTYNKNRISAVSVSDSILSLTPAKVTDGGSPWIRRGLSFSFPQADMFKIKFRMENCEGAEGALPQVHFHVSEDAKSWKTVSAKTATVGEWYVSAVSIPNAMKELNVKYLEVTFYGINGRDSTSRIDVDYIYAGPEWVVPDGHSYVYKATKEPTTSEAGLLTGTCSPCGARTTVTVPKLNTADYSKTVSKAATCTEAGTDTYRWKTTAYGSFTFTAPSKPKGHTPLYTLVDEGTHVLTCKNCDLRREEAHSYEEGLCLCGQKEPMDPVEEPTWKLSHSLNLASDISLSLVIPKSALAGFPMDTVYVESRLEVYEGNVYTGTKVLRLEPTEKGDYCYFTVPGLSAVEMNDLITSVLHGTKDGQEYYSPTDIYSVATYAYSQMNKKESSPKLKTLCADLLRYGAKAQLYKGYRTEALADSAMSEIHRAYLSDMEKVAFGNTNLSLGDLDKAPVTWVGKALNLDSKVELRFIFAVGSYEGALEDLHLKVTYADVNGDPFSVDIEHLEVYDEDYGYYAFTLDTLLAAELRTILSVQIYAGNKPVSCTLQYTADTYGNNKSGALGELCKALFAYSDSAKSYFEG